VVFENTANSLAVRIPSPIARLVSMHDSAVLVSPTGNPGLTLSQKLALFDSRRHGGEAMRTTPLGREAL